MPESLRAIKEAYKPIFGVLKAGKEITSGGLRRVATAKAPPSEVSGLIEAGKKFGTDIVQKASVHGEKISRASSKLQGIISKQAKLKDIGKVGGVGIGGLD